MDAKRSGVKHMKRGWKKASFTIEAAIYVPIILFVLFESVNIGLQFFQWSKTREINVRLKEIKVVEEFYAYQILGEMWEEMKE